MPNAACAAITVAPVLPALKSAAARPAATSAAATRIEAPGRRRSAAVGGSPIPITSSAWTMTTSSAAASGRVGQQRRRRSSRPDQRQRQAALACRVERPVDDGLGPVIAAHRVDGYPDHDAVPGLGRRLPFLDLAHLAAAVEAAVRAHLVRELRLVALRALGQRHGREGVVRPSLRGRAPWSVVALDLACYPACLQKEERHHPAPVPGVTPCGRPCRGATAGRPAWGPSTRARRNRCPY